MYDLANKKKIREAREIKIIKCSNLQNFPIEEFTNLAKIIEIENSTLASQVPENNLGIENSFVYILKNKTFV